VIAELNMKHNQPYYYGAGDIMFKRARSLRKKLTPAEDLLWQALRNRRIAGFKFRRQHPVGFYIADFYCDKALLIVEVDGDVHDVPEVMENDLERSKFIESTGIKIIRFRNEEVLVNLSDVLDEIERNLIVRKVP
jgi:cyclase